METCIQSSINTPYNTMITGSASAPYSNATGYQVTSLEQTTYFSSSESLSVVAADVSFIVPSDTFIDNTYPVPCSIKVGDGVEVNVVYINAPGTFNHTVNVSGDGVVVLRFVRPGDGHVFFVRSLTVEVS